MASIRKRVNGAGEPRYQVRWREGGGRDGQPQSATFPNRDDARTFRIRVEAAGERWPPDDVVDEALPTVREWTEQWLASRTGVTDRTRHDYRRDLTRHVLPTFGDHPVDLVTRQDVRTWIRQLEQNKLAPKTIANMHGLLAAVLGEAVASGLRPDNPTAGTRLPRGDRAGDEMTMLTPAEFALVRDSAAADARDLLTVLVGTGLRWSEATALEVRHVDLLAPTPRLHVVQAWKRRPDSSIELGPPKTRRSRRTIPLDQATIDALLPHLAGRKGRELVFTAAEGGPIRHGNFTWRRWHPAVKAAQKAGLEKRPRIHDLRHTHASWLLAAGVPITVVQRRLGHESIVTTVDTYGHLADDADLGVTAALDAALQPVSRRDADEPIVLPDDVNAGDAAG